MAAHHNHKLLPGQMKALDEAIRVACETHGPFENDEAMVQYFKPLLAAQNKLLRQELHIRHAHNNSKAKITTTTHAPPTVLLPHASHGGQPTTIGPKESNDPTISLDVSINFYFPAAGLYVCPAR